MSDTEAKSSIGPGMGLIHLETGVQIIIPASLMLFSMREAGVKSIKCDGLTITYVEKKETSRVDTKKLKAEMPEIAKKYMTSSIADDYILIKFK